MPRRKNTQRLAACALALALFAIAPAVHAQAIVDCVWPAPIHLSRIVGIVVDPSGEPLPDAKLTLSKDSGDVVATSSKDNGTFNIKTAAGTYVLRAERQYFAPLRVEVHLGNDMFHMVRPSYLYVIMGLNGTSCPWATTSKSEFKSEIQRYKSRASGIKEKHATQK